MHPAPARQTRQRVRLTVATVLLVAGSLLATLVLNNLFVQAHRVIGWAIACSIVAALVGPLVDRVAHVVPRPIALILAGLAIAAVVGALVYGVFDDLDSETAALREDGIAAATTLEERTDGLGEIARDLGLVDRATDFFSALDDRISSGGEAVLSAAGTAPTYFVCWILTIFLILHGPRIIAGGLALVTDDVRRERLRTILGTASTTAVRYVAAAVAQGLVVGMLAAGLVMALDLPAPVLIALLVGTLAMLPYIGILIGALPVAMLAAGRFSPMAGALMMLGGVALQTFEAFVVRPRIDRWTLHVGPAIPIIVAAVGFEIYGVGAALYGAAIAVFLLAVADAAATDDESIPLPTEDPSDVPA
jgi:predicted PurR-regulated permease PerM